MRKPRTLNIQKFLYDSAAEPVVVRAWGAGTAGAKRGSLRLEIQSGSTSAHLTFGGAHFAAGPMLAHDIEALIRLRSVVDACIAALRQDYRRGDVFHSRDADDSHEYISDGSGNAREIGVATVDWFPMDVDVVDRPPHRVATKEEWSRHFAGEAYDPSPL